MQIRLLYKKFLCVFMSLMLVIFSTQSAYSASPAGWTASASDAVIAGATATIKAFKGSGSTAMKAVIAHRPSAVAVGKELVKGAGLVALAYAASQLLGAGVDWVLDPANNRIKYTEAAAPDSGDGGSVPVGGLVGSVPEIPNATFASPSSLCAAAAQFAPSYAKEQNPSVGSVRVGDYGAKQIWDCGQPAWRGHWATPKQPPAGEGSVPQGKEKYIPINDVAAKVIANAEAGHAESQDFVKAVAVGQANAGDLDAALEAVAEPTTDTANPDIPADPTKPFDLSSILSALGSIAAVLAGIMSALTGFVDWWQAQWLTFSTAITDFNTWVRAEPDAAALEGEPVPVAEGTIIDGWQDKANAGYVNLGGGAQCPSDVLIPMSYMGASTNLAISYVPFCHFASIIKYAVIMGAWIAALMIISGGRTRE